MSLRCLPSRSISQVTPASALFVHRLFHVFAASKKGPKRRQFLYKDQLVWVNFPDVRCRDLFCLRYRRYEWEQSIDEVLLFIKTPAGVRAHQPNECCSFAAYFSYFSTCVPQVNASSLNVVIEPQRGGYCSVPCCAMQLTCIGACSCSLLFHSCVQCAWALKETLHIWITSFQKL
jgi:hypothetical protein